MPNPEETRAQEAVTLGYCAQHGWTAYEELEGQPAYCQMPVGPDETCAFDLTGPTRFIPAEQQEVSKEAGEAIVRAELERFAERVAGELEARAWKADHRHKANPIPRTRFEVRGNAFREAASLIRNSAKGEGEFNENADELATKPPDPETYRGGGLMGRRRDSRQEEE